MLKVVNAIAYRGVPIRVEDQRQWELTRGMPWDVESETVIDFVKKANSKINSGMKEYTTFQTLDAATSPREFPKLLSNYLNANGGSTAFTTFHNNYAQHKLKDNLKNSNLTEGAVIVFVHFQVWSDPVFILDDEGQVQLDAAGEPTLAEGGQPELQADKFTLLMVRNTGALQFNDDLQIDSTEVIDLKQFVQGCIVDNQRFIAHEASTETTESADNYISLLKGSADIREYFKEAIYAVKGVSNKLSSENLKKAFYDFRDTYEELDRDTVDQMEAKLYELSQTHKNHSVTLGFIGAALDECVSAELESEHQLRGKFVEFANQGDYEINDEFQITSNIISDFKFLSLDVEIGLLKLARNEIGSIDDGRRSIVFDPETNELSFKTTLTEQKYIDAISSIIK